MQYRRIHAGDIRAATSVFVTAIGLAALAMGAVALPAIGAVPTITTIPCTNLVSGTSWQITIDFAKSTVNSNPARISGAQITWHDASDGGNYTLDRRSGKLTVVVASSTGGYFLHDQCRLEN
jgi:hypothetical protein